MFLDSEKKRITEKNGNKFGFTGIGNQINQIDDQVVQPGMYFVPVCEFQNGKWYPVTDDAIIRGSLTPKRDANGKLMLDAEGRTIMEENHPQYALVEVWEIKNGKASPVTVSVEDEDNPGTQVDKPICLHLYPNSITNQIFPVIPELREGKTSADAQNVTVDNAESIYDFNTIATSRGLQRIKATGNMVTLSQQVVDNNDLFHELYKKTHDDQGNIIGLCKYTQNTDKVYFTRNFAARTNPSAPKVRIALQRNWEYKSLSELGATL